MLERISNDKDIFIIMISTNWFSWHFPLTVALSLLSMGEKNNVFMVYKYSLQENHLMIFLGT